MFINAKDRISSPNRGGVCLAILVLALSLQGCAHIPTSSDTLPGKSNTFPSALISSRCERIGLDRCSDIVDGILAFVNGNQEAGRESLGRAIAANAGKAEELTIFWMTLESVGKIPGAGKYIQPLQPIISLLKEAAKQAEIASSTPTYMDSPRSSTPITDTPPSLGGEQLVRPTPTIDLSSLPKSAGHRTMSMFLVPGTTESACPHLFPTNSLCVSRVLTEATIIQILVSSACPDSVIIAVGPDAMKPRWLLWNPPETALDLRGVTLPLKKYDTITVGVSGADLSPDVRCGVNIMYQ